MDHRFQTNGSGLITYSVQLVAERLQDDGATANGHRTLGIYIRTA